jgi:hypothetical protein
MQVLSKAERNVTQGENDIPFRYVSVEVGSNTSTVTLRVVILKQINHLLSAYPR